MADFETKLRWLSERGIPVGAQELIERIEADLAKDPLVVVAERREGRNMTKTQESPTTTLWKRSRGPALALAAFVVVLAVPLLYLAFTGDGDQVAEPTTVPTPTWPPSEAEVTELLNGFLEARVVGEGAQQYLNVPEEDIPLLYATSSGAPYERAEFEPVVGIEWPYEWMAFKVRLFAGDTVVEQLFFTPTDPRQPYGDSHPIGRLALEYVPDGFGTDSAPSTENGQPVARPYNSFDGEVSLHVAHPWVFRYDQTSIRLIPEGPGVGPTTDGGERNDWGILLLEADPAPVGTDCQAGPALADAEALAESIRSDPDLEATAPVAVSAGGAEALMMDVVIAAGASVCDLDMMLPRGTGFENQATLVVEDIGLATGDRMRLYLFDVPEGSSMQILAIAIIAPESSFERAVEAAAPVVDSLEFHTP